MSVNCTLVIMLCAEVTLPKNEAWDKLEPLMVFTFDKPLAGLSICDDSMSGKYCYAGRTLLKSKELMNQNFEFHGHPGYVVDMPQPTMQDVIDVKNLIKEKLGVSVALKDICVRAIFHYS